MVKVNQVNEETMEDNKYIKLPTIKSVKIKNYPLFNYPTDNYWKFEIVDGINLLLGANSIGKTTTMNMIIFGFIGNSGKIDTTYFSERLQNIEKDKPEQFIILEFVINDKLMEIHRNLRDASLLRFLIDYKEYDTFDYENIIYRESYLSLTDLKDLLQLLLIREEEGNYLLWNREEQSRIISVILNKVSFQHEYLNIENRYKQIDEESRRLKLLLENDIKQKDELERRKTEQLVKRNQPNNLETLNNQLIQIIPDREKLEKEKEQLSIVINLRKLEEKPIFDDFSMNKNQLKEQETELEALMKENEKLKELQTDNIFDNNLKLAALKISNQNICILCNKKVSAAKANSIKEKYIIEKECPICQNPIENQNSIVDENTIKQKYLSNSKRIKELNKQIPKTITYFKKSELAKCNYETEIKSWRTEFDELDSKLTSILINERSINNQLDIAKQLKPIEITDFDISIKAVADSIDELTKKHREKESERLNYLRQTLDPKRNKYYNVLHNFTEKLNLIFEKYATEYFLESCKLVLHKTESINTINPTVNFIPKFANTERLFKSKVSQSEAIFLEYLFRVSLLELYFGETHTKPFLFLETSEGVFDVANTELAAKLLSTFGSNKFPVIIVSNLSKEGFVNQLFDNNIKEKSKRMFNLIRFGKLTDKQKHNLQLKLYFEIGNN